MQSLLKRVVALAFGACCATGAFAEIDRASMVHLSASVVKIEAVNESGSFQLGSGVIVAPGKVVTNCHVTRSAARVFVIEGGIRWTAGSQDADVLHDLCVLRVPRIEGPPVPIAKAAELTADQDVLAIGYTGGIGIQVSEGSVVALHQWSDSDIVQSTNWFSSGASGGGLFTADGKLVGILTFRLRGGVAHYFSAPADWLLSRLEDDSRYRPIEPLTGSTFWELPGQQQPPFLQAAALEQTRQWNSLAQMAQRWSGEAGHDAEPPYMLAIAYDGLEQIDASIRALRRSLEIDPTYSRSWARLVELYKRKGLLRDARQALSSLSTLNPKLALQLSADLEKP